MTQNVVAVPDSGARFRSGIFQVRREDLKRKEEISCRSKNIEINYRSLSAQQLQSVRN